MSTHCGICFGQGHSEKNCDSKPRVREDDSNPMSKIGYGRGDDNLVQIMPAKVINVGASQMEPTVPMEAVETLTVKDIIHRLVERNLQAWRALPESIRDRMLERPQDFHLVGNKMYNSTSKENFDYDIVYNGTLWRYNGAGVHWVIADIIR